MPGAGSEPPNARYCTVPEAASRLGRSEQTVRNMLEDGRLEEGPRRTRGKRNDIRTVLVASLNDHIRAYGVGPGRAARHYDALAERVRALERQARARADRIVNLEFANLQLLTVNEEYERALDELLTADNHKTQAVVRLRKAVTAFRSIVEQYQLPGSPPGPDDDTGNT